VKTYVPNVAATAAKWWIVDAAGQNLGRLSTQIAAVLRGKHRPDFAPHLDLGDHVVVINASSVAVTGNRMADKRYYRHSGYPGGLHERTLEELMGSHPERVVKLAVRGMLPRGRLGRQLLGKLRVYSAAEHPHAPQQPVALPIKDTSRAERRAEQGARS